MPPLDANKDKKSKDRISRTCGVCGHPITEAYRGVPHKLLNKTMFCPYADDHSIAAKMAASQKKRKTESRAQQRQRKKAKMELTG